MQHSKHIFLACTLLLNSCAVIDSNRIAPGYTEAFSSIRNAITGYESEFITPDLIRNIPYASSVLKIGKGPKGLMILESIVENKQTWVSADGVFLVIEDGKIIQTSGLEHNLIKIERPKENIVYLSQNQKYPVKNYYSFDKPYLINLEVEVNHNVKESKLIKMTNSEIYLTLIEEEITNKKLGWRVKNNYWFDESGYIWKSEQFISPKLPVFRIEVTKKPSE